MDIKESKYSYDQGSSDNAQMQCGFCNTIFLNAKSMQLENFQGKMMIENCPHCGAINSYSYFFTKNSITHIKEQG